VTIRKINNNYPQPRASPVPALALHLCLLFFLFFPPAFAYDYNPAIETEVWLSLEPYFLPEDHPIKEKLDLFFQKKKPLQSFKTFKAAGFQKAKLRKATNIIVGKHPLFRGCLFKVYLESQPVEKEWENWTKRIEGANKIRACIKKHQYTRFTVPQKWIYPLPSYSSQKRHFVLIVEEMPILPHQDNLKKFRTIGEDHLDQLFCIILEAGLLDSVYPDNIPFTMNGKIAFIDTEHFGFLPEEIPFKKLLPYLSSEAQKNLLTKIKLSGN
jgi:hypothetical protein